MVSSLRFRCALLGVCLAPRTSSGGARGRSSAEAQAFFACVAGTRANSLFCPLRSGGAALRHLLLIVVVVITAVVLLVLRHLLLPALLVLDGHLLVLLLALRVQLLPLLAGDLRDLRDLGAVALEVLGDDVRAVLLDEEHVPTEPPLRLVRVLLLLALLALLLRGPARLRWHVGLHLLGMAGLVRLGLRVPLLLVRVGHLLPDLPGGLHHQ